VRNVRLWRDLLGVDGRTVIEDIEVGEEGADGAVLVVAGVRPRSSLSRRCGRCGARSPWYDHGEGRRRWRALDWGTVQVVLEADAPRVECAVHGPTVVAMPWARHRAGHTFAFDDTVAWLAVTCSKTAVCQLMRIAWRTVGAIVTRVCADTESRLIGSLGCAGSGSMRSPIAPSQVPDRRRRPRQRPLPLSGGQ
jgi:transposase